MLIFNLMKSLRNLITGKGMVPLKSFYDPRYPPTKFFRWNTDKIAIKCILCGFPRTGTHWIMNVIKKSTDEKTYNIDYNKPSYADKNVLLIKIHARNKLIARCKALWLLPPHIFTGKYIYTYRDPRDAIISLYEMYKHRMGVSSLTPQQFLKDYDPIGQYRWEIGAWVLPQHPDVLLVRFEALKHAPHEEFQRIFRYLDLEHAIDESSLEESVAQVESTHRPRRTVYGWKSAPAAYQELIETVSIALAKEVEVLQYEPL